MEVDMRSVDKTALENVDAQFQRAVDQAVREENDRWGGSKTLIVTKELVGDRPAGALPESAPIVRKANDVLLALGFDGPVGVGSSDANYPLSVGIPSLDIGGGGRGTEAHALGEASDTTDGRTGTQPALVLVSALAPKSL